MKKSIKTEEILKVYNIIAQAKYNKLDDDNKINLWKISRILKPIQTQYEDDIKDIQEKMKPTEDYQDKLQKAREYENSIKEGKTTEISKEEYDNFIKEYISYNNTIQKAVTKLLNKEVEIEFNSLSEEAFGKLLSSNDWNLEQTNILGEFIVE